ncbi:CHAT domain-containing protein [Streptomyces sp. NPDC090046]|uniref:CHAT domain-containing protein n=1 Tax=Streptomyces sp. NPDC090046 TaxID=3365928 RepID=UPI00381659B8
MQDDDRRTDTYGGGHPGGGTHHTGYRHVIGTLWSVYDRSAAAVSATVYGELTAGGRFSPARSAHALHTATRRLRDAEPDRPSAWMPFAHIGP